MKEDLPWFRHKKDARHSSGAKALIAEYGFEGYGRYDALLEIIASQPGARIDLSLKKNRAGYAGELRMSPTDFEAFIVFLADPDECGLIRYENGLLWSDDIESDYSRVERKRDTDKRKYQSRQPNDTGNGNSDNGKGNSDTGNDTERAEQSRIEQNRIPACSAEPAAAAELTEEIGKALSSCPYASRITKADHAKIAERLILSQLDAGFVAYCIKRTGEAKASNPGGFLRSALFGSRGYEEYPDAYRESRAKMQAATPSRDPPPKTCSECGGKITLIAGEAVCGKCGAAWTWYDDWQSWERSPESYQRVDLSALKPA